VGYQRCFYCNGYEAYLSAVMAIRVVLQPVLHICLVTGSPLIPPVFMFFTAAIRFSLQSVTHNCSRYDAIIVIRDFRMTLLLWGLLGISAQSY